jgi:uncharacterized membrane protein YphA (DoxX/SURF4 family)
MLALGMSEGIIVALIGGGVVLASGCFAWFGKLVLAAFTSGLNHLSHISTNSAETKVEVAELKHAITNGLASQTHEISNVVRSVNKLTDAVDEHSKILNDHDARLREVEQNR